MTEGEVTLKGAAEPKVEMSSPDTLAASILEQYAVESAAVGENTSVQPQPAQPANEQVPEAPEATAEATTGKEAVGNAEADKATPVADDPLKTLLMGGDAAPAEVPKEVGEYLSKIGVDHNDVVGLSSLKEERAALQKKHDELKAEIDMLAALPVDVKNLIVGLRNGDKEAIKRFRQSPSIEDWSKPFDQQDPVALLEHYAKGKVTAEDIAAWRDPEGDPALKRVVDGHLGYAKLQFSNDQKQQLEYIQNGVAQAQQAQQRLATSKDEAIQHLMTAGGPSAAAYKDILSRDLTPEKVLSLYFNEDGSWKKDAGLTYMRANGDLFRQVTAAQARQQEQSIKTEAAIEQVLKTSERPAPKPPAPRAVPNAPIDHAKELAMQIMARV